MLNRLPGESWDHILAEVRSHADRDHALHGYKVFVQQLAVCKAWAALATPHLYHDLQIDLNQPTLQRLAMCLMMTPREHPRRTWINKLKVNADVRDDEVHDPHFSLEMSNWLTIIIANSCLREMQMLGVFIQHGPMAVLSERSINSLRNLHVTLDPRDVNVLNCVTQLPRLETLFLDFDSSSRWPVKNPALISFENITPLLLPSVRVLAWGFFKAALQFYEPPTIQSLRYLAACRFHSQCIFYLVARYLMPDEVSVVNPLFLNHCSDEVRLVCPVPLDTTVFVQSKRVLFRSSTLPPPRLFDNKILAPFIKLDVELPDQLDIVWQILETLVESKFNHHSCVQIDALIRWSIDTPDNLNLDSGSPTPFYWIWPIDTVLSPQDEDMRARMMTYAKSLIIKGILIADCRMDLLTSLEDVMARPGADLSGETHVLE